MKNEEIASKIYSIIGELADKDLQRKLWLNEHNQTGLISSYNEVICSLFDDYGIDSFVQNTAIELGMSVEIINELEKLKVMLNDYNGEKTDLEIISDPAWQKIINQAEIVHRKWHY